jgi:hypothetical protein
MQVTQHRCHCSDGMRFVRNGNDVDQDFRMLASTTQSVNGTSLSLIPSSPYHPLFFTPPLGMVPISTHQQLMIMSTEIAMLWWWDPLPDMIKIWEEIRPRNIAANSMTILEHPNPHRYSMTPAVLPHSRRSNPLSRMVFPSRVLLGTISTVHANL